MSLTALTGQFPQPPPPAQPYMSKPSLPHQMSSPQITSSPQTYGTIAQVKETIAQQSMSSYPTPPPQQQSMSSYPHPSTTVQQVMSSPQAQTYGTIAQVKETINQQSMSSYPTPPQQHSMYPSKPSVPHQASSPSQQPHPKPPIAHQMSSMQVMPSAQTYGTIAQVKETINQQTMSSYPTPQSMSSYPSTSVQQVMSSPQAQTYGTIAQVKETINQQSMSSMSSYPPPPPQQQSISSPIASPQTYGAISLVTQQQSVSSTRRLCERCEEQPANYSCHECSQLFCASCEQFIHKMGKYKQHNRKPI